MRLAALLVILALSATAYAEPERKQVVVNDPVTVIRGGAWALDMEATRFLLSRDALDVCNADATRVPALEQALSEARAQIIEATKPEPYWHSALRGVAYGVGASALFLAGVWVGSR